jgi:hypothetical protein
VPLSGLGKACSQMFVDRTGVLAFELPWVVLHESPHGRQAWLDPVFIAREWSKVSLCPSQVPEI